MDVDKQLLFICNMEDNKLLTSKEKPNTEKEVEAILNPTIKKWFNSRFPSFSLPQLYGVLEIHSRNNILVSAPTGATKTLTGFLSILNELVDSAEKGILKDKVYCVYISPLKALSNDISKNLKEPLEQIEKIAGRERPTLVTVPLPVPAPISPLTCAGVLCSKVVEFNALI